MALSFFQRICLKFRGFNSQDATNDELRGLSRREALERVEEKRWELLNAYVQGEISGYQCRVFLNDYVRDSIHLADEIDTIALHQREIAAATLHRVTAPEDEEIEHSVVALLKQARSDRVTTTIMRIRFD
jgi:hypothetical protein